MENRFINVGFGSFASVSRILTVTYPDSAPAKRDMSIMRSNGCLRDYTRGRKIRSLVYLDDGSVIASSMLPETIVNRYAGKAGGKDA